MFLKLVLLGMTQVMLLLELRELVILVQLVLLLGIMVIQALMGLLVVMLLGLCLPSRCSACSFTLEAGTGSQPWAIYSEVNGAWIWIPVGVVLPLQLKLVLLPMLMRFIIYAFACATYASSFAESSRLTLGVAFFASGFTKSIGYGYESFYRTEGVIYSRLRYTLTLYFRLVPLYYTSVLYLYHPVDSQASHPG